MYADHWAYRRRVELRVCWEQETALYSFEGVGRHFQGEREYLTGHRGGVAQLGEHLLCKQGVIGSNPFTSTRVKDLGS